MLFAIQLVCVMQLCGQSLGVGYYDLDGLYDTIPSKFYDDTDYTPSGRRRWGSDRYQRKIRNSAAVLDSMALPIVGLYGVENEAVVRDIVVASNQDYSYIHRTRNAFDGMDFALLYYGDKLFVIDVEPLRNMLVVSAVLADDTPLTIILSRDGDDVRDYLSEGNIDQNELVLILGKLYQNQIDRVGYTNALKDRERQGQGNYSTTRGWVMRDRIGVNQKEKILKSGVYIAPWLLASDMQSALPTFDKYRYMGGYSKYLPIFTYIF